MASSTAAAASPPRAHRPARPPPGMLPGLHVDLRRAIATFWCGRCGTVLAARGHQAVPQFAAGVRAAHAPLCPGRLPVVPSR
jgi:hypothetical protein